MAQHVRCYRYIANANLSLCINNNEYYFRHRMLQYCLLKE